MTVTGIPSTSRPFRAAGRSELSAAVRQIVGPALRNTEISRHLRRCIPRTQTQCPSLIESGNNRLVVQFGRLPCSLEHKHNLALWLDGRPFDQLIKRAAYKLLVQLRQLPCHHCPSLTPTDQSQIQQSRGNTLGRLIEHTGALLGGDLPQTVRARAAAPRQETLEAKPVSRKATSHQRRDRRGRPWNDHHLVTRLHHRCHQAPTWVADPGVPESDTSTTLSPTAINSTTSAEAAASV